MTCSFVVGSRESPPPPIEIIHLTERSGTPALSYVRTGHSIEYAKFVEEWMKLLIFTTPICLRCKDLAIKLSFYMGLKLLEFLKNLKLKLE
jgi:hypothetical protein